MALRKSFWIFAWLASVLIGCGLVQDNTDMTDFTLDGENLLMSGTINSRTQSEFETIYSANPGITTLVEGVIDGSMNDEAMIKFAYRLRELGLNTHLTSDSEIYSGGVDLYLAGVNRTMESGAIIGVHAWADMLNEATDYPRASPEHEENRRYVADMLGQDGFYWFTIYAAGADDIHIMTAAEINKYQLLTAPAQ